MLREHGASSSTRTRIKDFRGFVMIKTAKILTVLSLLTCFVQLSSGIGKKKVVAPIEEDLLGPISCTVPNMPIPAAPAVTNPPTHYGAPAAPGNTATQQAQQAQHPPVGGAAQPAAANNAQQAGQHPGIAPGQAANNALRPGQPPNLPQYPGNNPPQPAPKPQPIASVKDCLAANGQVVILPDGQTVPIVIDNPDVLEGHEWQRLSVSGYLVGANFRIVSVRII